MKRFITLFALYMIYIAVSVNSIFAEWNQGSLNQLFGFYFSLSHDKKYLATLDQSDILRVYNIDSRNLEYILQNMDYEYKYDFARTGIAFSYDDKFLLKGNFLKWDIEKRKIVEKIHRGSVATQIEVTADGRYLAARIGSFNMMPTVVYLIDLYNNDTTRIDAGREVTDIRFSNDSKTLLYTTVDSKLVMVDVDGKKTAKEISFDSVETSGTFSLSHNDRYALISDSIKLTNYLFDLKEDKAVKTWTGGLCLKSDFSGNDLSFACMGDSSLEFRKTTDGSLINEIKMKHYVPDGVKYVNDEKILLISQAGSLIDIFDMKNNEIYPLLSHNGPQIRLRFLDNNRLLTYDWFSYKNYYNTFDCNNKKYGWRSMLQDSSVGYSNIMALSPDKSLLADFSQQANVQHLYLFNTGTGSHTTDTMNHTGKISFAAFSPDKKYIAYVLNDSALIVRDINARLAIDSISTGKSIACLFYNSTGDTIFLIRNAGRSGYFDVKSRVVNELNLTLNFEYIYRNSFSLSRDNSLFALIHEDQIEVYDLVKLEKKLSIPIRKEHWNLPKLDITSDNKFLAATIKDTIKIWDISTGALRKVIRVYPSALDESSNDGFEKPEFFDVRFSDDGKMIAASNSSGVFIRDIDLLGAEEKRGPASPDFSISPNPSSNLSTLCFQMEEAGYVRAAMYSYSGLLVKDFGRVYCDKGDNSMVIDNNQCPAGLYFIELSRGGRKSQRAMIVVK